MPQPAQQAGKCRDAESKFHTREDYAARRQVGLFLVTKSNGPRMCRVHKPLHVRLVAGRSRAAAAQHDIGARVGVVLQHQAAGAQQDPPAGSDHLGVGQTWPGTTEAAVGPLGLLCADDLYVTSIQAGFGSRSSNGALNRWRLGRCSRDRLGQIDHDCTAR